jgi:hypothetical protein
VAGRRAAAGLALAALGLTAAGCGFGGGTKTVTTTRVHTVTTTQTVTGPTTQQSAPCTGAELSATFAEVAGSGGAGQTAYLLTLTNTSTGRCYVFGLPEVQLLTASGTALPTHVAAAQGGSSGAKVVLAPDASAVSQARFSPDVPGPGDHQGGACQPKAATLRVTPDGGGTVDATVDPPTSVCEGGTLYFGAFAPAT